MRENLFIYKGCDVGRLNVYSSLSQHFHFKCILIHSASKWICDKIFWSRSNYYSSWPEYTSTEVSIKIVSEIGSLKYDLLSSSIQTIFAVIFCNFCWGSVLKCENCCRIILSWPISQQSCRYGDGISVICPCWAVHSCYSIGYFRLAEILIKRK